MSASSRAAELPTGHNRSIHIANVGRKNCSNAPNCGNISGTLRERELSGYEKEDAYPQDERRREHNFEEILGNSLELLKLLDRVQSTAPTDANVLIIGETGSGKELVARAIHSRSA